MTEILTESFCERCGTRYTFETVQQRALPLSRLGTFGRGLKNFVVMPDASFDEAMAVARSDDESRTTTAHLEAFHRTFNFCLTCRQYTCAECWNGVEGRCLTCAPMPLAERPELPQALATTVIAPPVMTAPILVTPVEAAPVAAPPPIPPIETRPAEPPEAEAEPVTEPVAAVESEPEAEAEPETEPIAAVEPEPEPKPAVETAVAAPEGADEPQVAAEPPPVSPFPGFLPGRSLDDEIAAYELRIAALETPASPEPTIQPAAVIHREPLAIREPVAREAAVTAGEVKGSSATAIGPTPANNTGPAPMPGTCRSCGLSISASARFCRRCGTRQEN